MNAPLITTHGLRRVNFPACNADACHQGDKPCPCPEACQVADDFDPSKPNVLASAVKYDFLLIAFVLVVVAFIGAVPYLF